MASTSRGMEAGFERLIDTLYESVIDESAFSKFFQDFANLTHCHFAGVEVVQPGPTNACQWRESGAFGISSEMMRQLNTTYAAYNPFVDLVAGTALEGDVFFSNEVMSQKQYRNLLYYDEFLRHYDFDYLSGLYVVHNPERSVIVSTSRDKHAGPFSKTDRELMQQLSPHLQRLFRLREYVGDSVLEAKTGWGALNYLPYGAAIVDRNGKALFMNEQIKASVAAGDGLTIEKRKLTAKARKANDELRLALRKAVSAYENSLDFEGVFRVPIERPSGKRPYYLQILPLRNSSRAGAVNSPAAAIFVFDLEATATVDESALIELFGLTPAEAKVAALISQGLSLDEIAVRLDHSVSTTRTTLKRVYTKTNTHRQNELATIILTGVGHLVSPTSLG